MLSDLPRNAGQDLKATELLPEIVELLKSLAHSSIVRDRRDEEKRRRDEEKRRRDEVKLQEVEQKLQEVEQKIEATLDTTNKVLQEVRRTTEQTKKISSDITFAARKGTHRNDHSSFRGAMRPRSDHPSQNTAPHEPSAWLDQPRQVTPRYVQVFSICLLAADTQSQALKTCCRSCCGLCNLNLQANTWRGHRELQATAPCETAFRLRVTVVYVAYARYLKKTIFRAWRMSFKTVAKEPECSQPFARAFTSLVS